MQLKNAYVRLCSLGYGCLGGILLAGCADLSKTGKIYETDITPQMQQQATRLNQKSQGMNWQTLAPSPEIDEIRQGSAGNTFVGYLDLELRYQNSPALVPYYGPYVMYDTTSGRELWRHDRDSSPAFAYSTLLTDPYVVYTRKSEKETNIISLDPKNGKVVWETTVESAAVNLLANGQRGVLAVHRADLSSELQVLSLTTGKPIWATKLPGSRALLEYDGDRLMTMANNVIAVYSLQDGKRLWNVKLSGQKSEPVNIVINKQGYLITWHSGLISQISMAGKLVWEQTLPGVPELVTLSGTQAIIAARSASAKGTTLHALSLASGKQEWHQNLSSKLHSALYIEKDKLVFTTTDGLESLALRDGRRLFHTTLAGRQARRLPDHIVIYPEHIAIASESVVSGHTHKNGRELWQIKLNGTEYLNYDTAYSDVRGTTYAGADRNANVQTMSIGIDSMNKSSEFYARQAQQNYINVYNRTQSAISSGTAAEKSDAYFERNLAASHVQNVNTINSSIDMAMLSVNAAMSILDAARSVETNARIGAAAAARDRAYKRMTLSYRIHQTAKQGDYYLRPFRSRGGNGIIMVNMRSGMWAEVPTSPSEAFLEDNIYMSIMMGLVVNQNSLVTFGTGLDPDKWLIDDRYEPGKMKSTVFAFALDERSRTKLIRRSLLSYNMSEVHFNAPAAYQNDSLTNRKSKIIR